MSSMTTTVDECEEVLRYLHLLKAMEMKGAPSWDGVRNIIGKLRETCQLAIGGADSTTQSAEVQAMHAVREARLDAQRKAEERDKELKAALQQARELQRECEQLKMRLSLERQQTNSERRRLALASALSSASSSTSPADVKADEEKLRQARLEVQDLRCKIFLKHGLEQWQVDKLDALRMQVDAVREVCSKHKSKSREARMRLQSGAGPSWASVQRSIQRVRDQCQLAVQEALVPRGASTS
jgi:vacuolar-type H+-ATPase subunit I/STV1